MAQILRKTALSGSARVSPEDLELVHALQIAPRASWAELGAVLERHPTTLSARWAKLRESRTAWILGHLGGRSGQHCTVLVEVEADPQSLSETCALLCRLPEVLSVHNATRRADFVLTCIAESWEQLARVTLPGIRAVPGVRRVQTSAITQLFASGESFRLDALSAEKTKKLRELVPEKQPAMSRRTPEFWQMLEVLQRDGRASAREIAAATGQHPTTVARSLAEALRSRALVVRCEIGLYASGHPFGVMWNVNLPVGLEQRAVAHLRSQRRLRLCASTTGESNFVFVVQLRSPLEVAEIERGLAEEVPQMRIVDSLAGVRYFKRMGWLLDDDELPTAVVTASGAIYPAKTA